MSQWKFTWNSQRIPNEIVEGIPKEEVFKITEAFSTEITDFLRIFWRKCDESTQGIPERTTELFFKESVREFGWLSFQRNFQMDCLRSFQGIHKGIISGIPKEVTEGAT